MPAYERYEFGSRVWGDYIRDRLREQIVKGKGHPNKEWLAGLDFCRTSHAVVVRKGGANRGRDMPDRNYTVTISVDKSPQEVFNAVIDVRRWWSDNIDGPTDKLGSTFKFHEAELHYSTQRITELVPGKKVVWTVTESQINFVKNKKEWTGTKIVFDIARRGDKSELRFTHVGLVPAIECYGDCAGAWRYYLQKSLKRLIETGTGNPTLHK